MKFIYKNDKWFCPNCNLSMESKSEKLHSIHGEPELVEGTKEWCCPLCKLVYNQEVYYDVVKIKKEEI